MKGTTGKTISHQGGWLKIFGLLMRVGLPLMKSVLTPLAKSFLIPLGLTTAPLQWIQLFKRKFLDREWLTLIISNDKIVDIIKILISLAKSGLLIKGANERSRNESKEQKGRFLCILMGKLGAILLWNILAGKGVIRAGKEIIRAGQDF